MSVRHIRKQFISCFKELPAAGRTLVLTPVSPRGSESGESGLTYVGTRTASSNTWLRNTQVKAIAFSALEQILKADTKRVPGEGVLAVGLQDGETAEQLATSVGWNKLAADGKEGEFSQLFKAHVEQDDRWCAFIARSVAYAFLEGTTKITQHGSADKPVKTVESQERISAAVNLLLLTQRPRAAHSDGAPSRAAAGAATPCDAAAASEYKRPGAVATPPFVSPTAVPDEKQARFRVSPASTISPPLNRSAPTEGPPSKRARVDEEPVDCGCARSKAMTHVIGKALIRLNVPEADMDVAKQAFDAVHGKVRRSQAFDRCFASFTDASHARFAAEVLVALMRQEEHGCEFADEPVPISPTLLPHVQAVLLARGMQQSESSVQVTKAYTALFKGARADKLPWLSAFRDPAEAQEVAGYLMEMV